jgi:cytochrome c biogenesis protein CcdA
MTTELVLGLVGLALLDSINTSTLFLVMVILLMGRRPVASGVAYTIGATLSFFGLALGLYFGASAAEANISDAARWIRRGTFALLALWLLSLAYKRLRDRPRKPFTLPGWFRPVTALPIGVAATIADLPNAFPLFIAVERLVSAEVGSEPGVLAWVGYTVVYAAPIVVVLILGATQGERARRVMRRVTDRLLTGVARRSLPLVAAFTAAGLASAALVAVV